jgi:hypothetical protein
MDRLDRQANRIQSAIERIRQGDDPSDVLTGFDPESAGLVRLATALDDSLPTRPDPTFRARLQVQLQDRAFAAGSRTPQARPAGFAWRVWWPRLGALTIALALVLGSAVVASANSLPGDTLYGVKRTVEETRIIFTVDPAARAMAHLHLAEVRLAEIRRLVDRGIVVPAGVIEDFLDAQANALREAKTANDPGLLSDVERQTDANAASLAAIVGPSDAEDVAVTRPTVSPRAPTASRPAVEAGGGGEGAATPSATDMRSSAEESAPAPSQPPAATSTPTRVPTPASPAVATQATPEPTTQVAPTRSPPTSTEAPTSDSTSPVGSTRDVRLTEWARMTATGESSRPNAAATPQPTATEPAPQPTEPRTTGPATPEPVPTESAPTEPTAPIGNG